jgi:3-oxosteroid 1-dehydrogenase
LANGWDYETDFLIVGSGAASICAALVAKRAGKRAVIAEKTDMFGGSTGMSGGVFWVPNNPVMKRAGVADTPEQARTYLDACVGEPMPGSTAQRRETFLTEGPQAIAFLESYGMALVHAEGYSDYHEGELPGGLARGRSIVAKPYNRNRLGEWKSRFRCRPGLPVMMHEVADLTLNGATLKSKITMAKVGLRMAQKKLGRDLVGMGGAIQGRLLEIGLREQLSLWLESPLLDLVVEDGEVLGGVIEREGRQLRVRAHSGVLLGAGGFSHNQTMREEHQRRPVSVDWTNANPGDTGEVMAMAIRLGATVNVMEQSWWTLISILPNGLRATHPLEMSHPYSLMVDQSGERYVNESASYLVHGKAMYDRDSVVPAIPSWFICDSRFRNRYRWAGAAPGKPPAEWLTSGYMIETASLGELARRCGMEEEKLRRTVARFNGFAASGVDEDFGRGSGAYHRFLGDPTVKPNPNLGAVEKPPFYAVKLYPGDVGTAGGLVTDEYARVQREDGSIIPGLYATGNITAPVVGRSYPGAGASIAASLVFGYVAARHALCTN